MVADHTLADGVRAIRAHGLPPVLSGLRGTQELTDPTPYGPDFDKGDGYDANSKDKLGCVR